MGRTFEEVMATLPAEDQAEINARAAELIEEVKTLRELRAVAKVSQAKVAEGLGVSQPAVSKFEREGAEAAVARLAEYAHLLGGQVEVVFRLPDHGPIRVRSLDVLAEAIAEPILDEEVGPVEDPPVAMHRLTA